jgi:Fe-S cluster biosynthesis and repair protein YggX
MAIVTCPRCGRTTEGMSRPPLTGQLGQEILARVCPDCWTEWRQESINVINHNGLQPADPADRQKLRAYLREFLKLPDEIA